jgi:GntR family transcriptional regulator
MVSPGDPQPPSRQIAQELRRSIVLGELAPGARLPSARELAIKYGVTHVTGNQALNLLKNEGLVDARPGRGVFVREPPRRRRVTRDRKVHRDERGYYFDPQAKHWVAVEPPVLTRGTVPDHITPLLRVAAGSEVIIRDRRMGEPGGPALQLATSYLPADLTRGTRLERPDTGLGGIYDRLEEMGHELRWVETITARMPTPEEVAVLRIAPGVPVLQILRVTLGQHDRPLEVNDTRMAADQFEVSYPITRE